MNFAGPPAFHGTDSIEAFVRRASAHPRLAPRDEVDLSSRAHDGDALALQALVRPHLRMVIDEAIRHRGLGCRQPELIDCGVEALVAAARRYSGGRDGAFAPLARHAVQVAMGRLLDAP